MMKLPAPNVASSTISFSGTAGPAIRLGAITTTYPVTAITQEKLLFTDTTR
jgi:hypothetical protein